MRILLSILLLGLLASCWPTSVSFKDKGSMPETWVRFTVKTLENSAPNAPLSYPALLSESVKDGVQNNTKLRLTNLSDSAQVNIEGNITNYSVSPVALQLGDVAAKNRLTISVNFTIFINVPPDPNAPVTEDKMTLTSTRFIDYNSTDDLAAVEGQLLEEINKQIVQDVINKLLSNW